MRIASAFTSHNADAPRVPVLLSVPHAGRDYPPALIANLRVPPAELLRLEDRYADRLVQPAISAGFPAILAHRARAWIDLNRAATDFDIDMLAEPGRAPKAVPSAKTRGGLGLIPRRLQASGELWRRPLGQQDLVQRIDTVHRPFHQSIANTLAAMRDKFGMAILLDIHSMPPILSRSGSGFPYEKPPNIVIGDRFGRSAASIYAELAIAHIKTQGIEVALNNPYSGDFILAEHGNPQRGIHAIQIEVDRSLYLDSALREPSGGLGATARLILEIASLLVEQAAGSSFAEAAE